MTIETIAPLGCTYCDVEERGHGNRWTARVGWHRWVEPTRTQIVERMRASRGIHIEAAKL